MATNAAALAVGGVVAQVAFLSVEVAIARHLGRADYGVFSTVYVIALTSLFIIDLGMSWRLIESGSRKSESIAELLGTTAVIKFIGFVLLYPLIVLGLAMLGHDTRTIAFFAIFFGYALVLGLQDSLMAVYTARQRMIVNALFQGGSPVVIAAFVAVALMLGGGLNTVGAAYVTGGLMITGVWAVMAWRAERPRVRMASSGRILRGSYLYGLTGLLSQVFYKSDILLLSALTTMPQVGIYAAGYKLLDLAYKIPVLGARVVSPALFQQSHADERSYRVSADGFVRLSIASGLLLTVAVYPSTEWFIGLTFGADYAGAAIVLRILSGSFLLKFLASALQTVLTTRGQHSLRTGILAISTALAAVGHIVLIPIFGASGAALSVVGGEAILCASYLRGIGDVPLRARLTRRVLGAGLAGVPAVLAPGWLGLTGPAASGVALVICVTAFLATGFVRVAELRRLWKGIAASPARPTREIAS